MKPIRNPIGKSAAWMCALILACALFAPRAQAQALVNPECVTAKGGERQTDLKIFRTLLPWHEQEGQWSGTWTPTDPENWSPTALFTNYHARFHKSMESSEANLQIYIRDNSVLVTRQQDQGRCQYRGTFQGDWRVVGTYTCSWHVPMQPWSAMIGNGQPPIPCTTPQANDPRLKVMWNETEGDWRGRWTPRGGLGDYDGHWTHATESAGAGLQIKITGTTVQITRTQAEGSCNYNGTFGPNGWTVSGTYMCAWHRGRLPWSAVIGPGHP